MRSSLILAATLSACALVSVGRAQDIKFAPPGQAANAAPAPAAPVDRPAAIPAPAPTFTDAQLTEEAGWLVARRTGLENFDLTPAEIEALGRGVALNASRQNSPYDVHAIGPQMNAFMLARQSAHVARVKGQNEATAAVFFAKLKENPAVKETPSGLRYQIFKAGTAPFPGPKDVVVVNYTGRLLNGTVFDTSLRPRQPGAAVAPGQFRLDGMIPGWTEGLQLIGQGGEMRLYIPANLAYGDEDRLAIPAGSTLVFDIQLLDVKPAPAPR